MTIVIFEHNRKNNSLLGSMQCFHFERFTETPLLGKDKFSGGRGSPPTTAWNIVTQIFQGFFSIFFKTCLKILIFQVPPPDYKILNWLKQNGVFPDLKATTTLGSTA